MILGDDIAKVEKWHTLFKDPAFIPKYNTDWHECRERPMRALKKVADSGLVSVKDFFGNPKNIFLAHEFIAQVDGATVIKFTVQYNLFGGSITALHTERHAYLFDKIDSFDIVGCFCLTELGFGNNAVKMETTVAYDEKKAEFVVNTPTTLSQKYWITNGFKHSNHALVFGQTIVAGKNEGVGAFLVPIRDASMREMPGVEINDMGAKMGSNGVDNASLRFTNVRIPRVNMMNKYTDVDANGKFSSPIKGLSQRFFQVTERLLSGRLCIASMCVGAARSCLFIAITYAQQRLAVGPKGESDTPIFKYQLQQNALVPLLARSVSLGLFHVMCKGIFQDPRGFEDEVLSLCCIDKTMNGWNLERVASIGRERCGGQGYLAVNKFGDYLATAHAALTAEGDNRVLMVKICKDMLTNIFKKGHKLPEMTMCPYRQIGRASDVTSLDILLNLLKFRETMLFQKLVGEQKRLKGEGKSAYQILMRETSDVMQDLAMAYGERHCLQYCIQTLGKVSNQTNKEVLAKVFRLFGAEIINRDLASYILAGVVSKEAQKNLTETRMTLIKEIALCANDILDCMSIPKHALYAPIAGNYIRYNAYPNFGEVIGAKL